MNKQFKLSIICLIILLMSAMSVQAGVGSPDSASATSTCEEVTVMWSHSSGVSTVITIYLSGGPTIGTGTFDTNSGSQTIDIDPDLTDGDTINIELVVKNGAGGTGGDVAYTDFVITCTVPPPVVAGEPVVEEEKEVFLCADGRLTYTLCNPLVVYNVISDDGAGIIIYTSDPESNGLGEFKLEIPAEIFDTLPANPEANCTIASSDDGTVVVYLLTTGEIQVNTGPDAEDNKVFVYIFSDLVSPPTSMDTYITPDSIEILPSCLG